MAFTNVVPDAGIVINNSTLHPAEKNTKTVKNQSSSNSNAVAYPGQVKTITVVWDHPKYWH